MAALIPSVPTLAVSVIYCLWYTYQARQAHGPLLPARDRQRLLRERVTYMLWQAAQHAR